MEAYFSSMSEDISQKNRLLFLLSPTDPHIIKQNKPTGYEKNLTKNLALENLFGWRSLKEYVAV